MSRAAQRVAIISGAGKGLGRAYALELASRGMAIVVNNRRHATDVEPSAAAVVREIRDAGGMAVANYGPAEDPETGESLLALALETFGRLDVVIANAGVSEAATFVKQDVESFNRTLTINLQGTAYLLLPSFRHLYAQGSGHVLVSTSAAGLYGEHGLPAYSAAKAGLIGLMHSLALEGRAHGVFVNAIAPFARTQMTDDTLSAAGVKGLGPEEVAPIVAELVAADATISGEVVIAAGGRIARAAALNSQPRSCADGEDARALLTAALADPLTREYPGAVAMFGDFIK
ncbi:MAG: SDR family NAD(P)-dependent oxidoreductase [Congregibacter sp.]